MSVETSVLHAPFMCVSTQNNVEHVHEANRCSQLKLFDVGSAVSLMALADKMRAQLG